MAHAKVTWVKRKVGARTIKDGLKDLAAEFTAVAVAAPGDDPISGGARVEGGGIVPDCGGGGGGEEE